MLVGTVPLGSVEKLAAMIGWGLLLSEL
jgi:hypothetical protein